jgi:hypothetical protein
LQKWVQIERYDGKPGINQIKMARMVSKAISLARLKYGETPQWKKVSKQLDSLELIRMSLSFLFESEQSDLVPYFESHATFTDWERFLNESARQELAYKLEIENPNIKLRDDNGKIIDKTLFLKLAMREAKSTKDIPGSKKAYVSWEAGATPADPLKMGLAIIGGDLLEVGNYVVTEFGPAIVSDVKKDTCRVELFGRKKVNLPRNKISMPETDSGKELLNEIIKDPSKWRAESAFASEIMINLRNVEIEESMAPKGKKQLRPTQTPAIPVLSPKPITKLVEDKPIPVDDMEEDEMDAPEIEDLEVNAFLINTMTALRISNDAPVLKELGWKKVEPYLALQFNNWGSMESFIETVNGRFHFKEGVYDKLYEEIELIKVGRAMRVDRIIKQSEIRQFFLEDSRKLGNFRGMPVVDPYISTSGRDVRLVFSKKAHAPEVITWINAMTTKHAGRIKKPFNSDSFWIKFFASPREAAEDIRSVGRKFNIPKQEIIAELTELRDELIDLKKQKTRPLV